MAEVDLKFYEVKIWIKKKNFTYYDCKPSAKNSPNPPNKKNGNTYGESGV